MSTFSTSSPTQGITVISFPEQVLGGPDAVNLAGVVRDVVSGGGTLLVLDLADVSVMNSSGLGMLVATLSTTSKHNVALRLAAVPEKVASLLSMTQLTQVFDIRDTVDNAVSST
jgi:anti-sigma B factor antagonist